MKYLVIVLLCGLLLSCSNFEEKIRPVSEELFNKLGAAETGITFKNEVKEDKFNNLLSNFYIYNGAGVAIGDINNDGLEDIYFVSNQKQDHLYLNKGELIFEEISKDAGINNNDGWSTGVSMIDINNDGWLDIYVCKSSPVKNKNLLQNKLYINLKNNKFKESSEEYGLAHLGFSVQSYFLDYDKDGDLDMYLIDHQMRNIVFNENVTSSVKDKYIGMSNQLFRNDNGYFNNVTKTSFDDFGIYPSLSAVIGDFNQDNWPDIYVCNDFLLPDQLFINDQNGSFSNKVLDFTNHTSSNSMGSDYADINNDLLPDLMVLDMLASDHIRSKENMNSMNSKLFDSIVDIGYGKQYMSNVLQLNTGQSGFQEIGQLIGINKTDWSWSALFADFDNDGLKDIFVSNGIEKDIDNRDFRNEYQQILDQKKPMTLEQFHGMIPSSKQANRVFQNNGNLSFIDQGNLWGLDDEINSNGAAYADLDNDGDLDLVLNNMNDFACIYENRSTANYLSVSLKGNDNNPQGIGAKVILYSNSKPQVLDAYSSRGFLSSMGSKLNFGLADTNNIDSLIVIWGNDKKSTLTNLDINKNIVVDYDNAEDFFPLVKSKSKTQLFAQKSLMDYKIDFRHNESVYNDYGKQLLLPQKQSVNGKCLNVADLNNDGLDDLFFGNAAGSSAEMYLQVKGGVFEKVNTDLFDKDKSSENINSIFFDADSDGDLDLYIANGSYEFEANSSDLRDHLYINDGMGSFIKDDERLPLNYSNSSVVISHDIDLDGDMDLFVGGREIPGEYPKSSDSFFLENTGKEFRVANDKFAPEFQVSGMINDALFSDFDQDGDQDLIVVGEWMSVLFYTNENGVFRKSDILSSWAETGWYTAIKEIDVNKDGLPDYVIGNYGKNNKFKPSKAEPLHIYANYFDENSSYDIALSKNYKGTIVPVRGLDCSAEQNPYIHKNAPTFKSFANSSIADLYGEDKIETALHLRVHSFESIVLLNKGNDKFQHISLPNECQFSPTMDFEIQDFNNDGYDDIIGIGNFYESEVETISYNAGRAYVLINDQQGLFEIMKNSGLHINKNSRSIKKIKIKKEDHIVVLNNNDDIDLIKIIK